MIEFPGNKDSFLLHGDQFIAGGLVSRWRRTEDGAKRGFVSFAVWWNCMNDLIVNVALKRLYIYMRKV